MPSWIAGAGRGLRLWVRDYVADADEKLSRHPRLMDLTRWPIVRGMARRRGDALFDLCAGFVYSQVLSACVDLDLFELLTEGEWEEAELARRLDLDIERAARLFQAAQALRLIRRTRRNLIRLGPLGAAVVADPGITAMVLHHRLLYADLGDPVAALRGANTEGRLAAFWPYEAQRSGLDEGAKSQGYTRLMSASQRMVARQVLAAYAFDRHTRLLDVGGGDGSFLREIGARYPALQLALFDLPSVAAQANSAFATRAQPALVVGGDFCTDALPDADVVSLVRILHDHPDETALALLGNIRRHLAPGTTLLIAEPLADTPSAPRVGDAYFPIYLMLMGRGRTRSSADIAALLARTGFGPPRGRATPLPMIASVLLTRAV